MRDFWTPPWDPQPVADNRRQPQLPVPTPPPGMVPVPPTPPPVGGQRGTWIIDRDGHEDDRLVVL